MSSGRQEMLKRVGSYGRQVREARFDAPREREEAERQEELAERIESGSPELLEGVDAFNESFHSVLESYGGIDSEQPLDVRAEAAAGIDQALLSANENAQARVEARSLSPEERQAKLTARYLAAELKPTEQAAPESSADAIIDALTPAPAEELDEEWLEAEDDAVYEDEAGSRWVAEDDGWKPFSDEAA